MSDSTQQAPNGEFVLFQAAIADLYQISPQAITQHIKAVYEEEELEQNSTCKSYLQVGLEGSRKVSRNLRHIVCL